MCLILVCLRLEPEETSHTNGMFQFTRAWVSTCQEVIVGYVAKRVMVWEDSRKRQLYELGNRGEDRILSAFADFHHNHLLLSFVTTNLLKRIKGLYASRIEQKLWASSRRDEWWSTRAAF